MRRYFRIAYLVLCERVYVVDVSQEDCQISDGDVVRDSDINTFKALAEQDFKKKTGRRSDITILSWSEYFL